MFFYLNKNKKLKVQFYNIEEIKNLISCGKSIIRLGDGEIGILHKNKILYQDYSDELKNNIKSIVKNYNGNSDYLLSIPIFVNYSNAELDNPHLQTDKNRSKKLVWMPLKATFLYLFNKKAKYIDAHIFYRDKFLQNLGDYIFNLGKNIILVSDQKTFIEIENNKSKNPNLNKIKYFIESGDGNTFEKRFIIKKQIENIFIENNLNKNDVIILWKGALAKTLIRDMCGQYQFIDVGAGFDFYINGKSKEYLI